MADWPPKKNAAFTVVFPIYDADGDLVTAAASLDSEYSGDKGTFTDCSNEATELATSSGVYYLDLIASEMNYDVVVTITKTATGGAKTAVNAMYTVTRQLLDLAYPATSGRSLQVETDGMVHADVKEWLAAAPNALQTGRVDSYTGAMAAGVIDATAIGTGAIDADAIAADAIGASEIADNAIDAGAIANDAITAAKIANGAIDAATFAAGAIDASAIATDAIDADALAADALAEINAEVDTALADIDLDHLIQVAAGAENPTLDSYLDQILNKDGSQTFSPATDSLEAQVDSRPTNWSSMGIEADGHVHGDLKEWLGVAPNALQSGRVDSYVGAMVAGVITAAVIATDAIDADAIADNAIDAGALAANCLTAAKIATDAITSDEIAQSAALEIADAILQRDMDQVEGAAPVHSLTAAILKAVSRIRDNAGTLEVYETDGTTLFSSQSVTTDAGLNPVDELSIAS